jgi:hypothetical protein
MIGSFAALAMLGGPIPPQATDIVVAFFTTIVIIALGVPLIRALGKRWERTAQLPAPPSPEITARLERIEQAVDAVAIEVERIAEAQRFAVKLMAEQPKRALPDSPPRT